MGLSKGPSSVGDTNSPKESRSALENAPLRDYYPLATGALWWAGSTEMISCPSSYLNRRGLWHM
jgi:hypothetical protein